MGIPNLLTLLKSIITKRHIRDYKDQTVGIDVYTWLHPAIYTCSYELANGIETTKHIEFCTKRVDQILSYGVKKIVLVFDGRYLPSKKGTEEKREKNREECKNEALKLLAEGKKDQAHKKFASSVDVTPQMAYEFIQAVKGRPNIECIVAPYEADAQLAYLSKIDYIDVAFSEDSDLLAFGCKRVLFKLYKGETKDSGDEICLDNIKNCKDMNLSLWDQNMFLTACILTGCDYLPSLKKIGINNAFKLVGEHKLFKKCILSLQSKNYEIPADYDEKFQLAFLTFRFQYVYCPIQERMVHLNKYDLGDLKLQYIDKDLHNQKTNTVWKDFEENVLVVPLIYRILSEKFNWNFLGDMDEDQVIKVGKYLIDPISLEPYKEIKSKMFGFEGAMPNSVRMGNGGLSSLQNKNKFELKSRQQTSQSDSVLATKQSSLNNFLKVGVPKSNVTKINSYDDRTRVEKSSFLMEDANSNSMNYTKSKSNDKGYNSQESLSLSQQALDMFSKNIFNKNSSVVKPFKPPSASNSQNTQPNNTLVSKKKSDLKRSYNEEYFDSEEDEQQQPGNTNVGKIIESQLEDSNSSRKESSFNATTNFQNYKDFNRKQQQARNENQIEEEEEDIRRDGDQSDMINNQFNFASFKSNDLISKNIENNIQKQKSGLSGLAKQEYGLSNKFQNKLVIDKTPINDIQTKYPSNPLKNHLEIKQISKISQKYDDDEMEDQYDQEIMQEGQNIRSRDQRVMNQFDEKINTYQQQQSFIKRVMFEQQQEIQRKGYDSQDDEKSCVSTQSQKNIVSNIEGANPQTANEKVQSQRLTQKTSSNDSSCEKQEKMKEGEEGFPSIGSSLVASTAASNDKNNTSRLSNFTKEVDGSLVIDSQYLMKEHPEYNFLEKYSMFFKNEINI